MSLKPSEQYNLNALSLDLKQPIWIILSSERAVFMISLITELPIPFPRKDSSKWSSVIFTILSNLLI